MDPRTARLAGLVGVALTCDGESKTGYRPLYPITKEGSTVGAPRAAGNADWFGLEQGEYAWLFLTDVDNGPVVISIHINAGQVGFAHFESRAMDMLRTLRFER